VSYAAPLLAAAVISAPVASAASASREFEFVTPLNTIELLDALAVELKQKPGLLDVSGSERTVTVTWDSAKLDETRVRQVMAETGHPVKP
jgi:hypothetical protein